MAENGRIALKDINETLHKYQVQGFDGVTIDGDIEIEIDIKEGEAQFLAQNLGQEFTKLAAMLLDFSKSMGYPVEKIR